MRAVFLGTPVAAVPALRALQEVADVIAVITRPDAARGRSGTPQPSPVAAAAQEQELAVFRPSGRSELAAVFRRLPSVDVGVVVAFGMILGPEILDRPGAGFVNVHFSLLPRWRGAAPVQRSILAGDQRTGVSLMRLDAGLDTGPVVATWSTAIGDAENAVALTDRLAVAGAHLLGQTLGPYVDGRVACTPQDDARATYAAKLTTEERWLGPSLSVAEAERRVRGLTPWPGAWISHDTGPVRVTVARRVAATVSPGTVADVDGLVVLGFADGALGAIRVQPSSKREMDATDWARGLQTGLGSFR